MTFGLPLRSWLYVPGGDAHKVAKAATSGADVVILDLEDGVAAADKERARSVVADALAGVDFAPSRRFVRVNALSSEHCHRDCEVACDAGADGIVVPKASDPVGMRRLADLVGSMARPRVEAPVIAAIVTEDVEGVFAAARTIAAHDRVAVAMWGSEDLSASLGAWRVKDDSGTFLDVFRYVRSSTLLHAARLGRHAIDTPFLVLHDDDALAREACEAAWMGFAGKQAIHPRQVPIINRAFTPAQRDIEAAEALVAAFEEAGAAVVRVGGQMADSPHLLRARRILALARALDGPP